MPRKIFNSDSEDDEFETEAFQFMNKRNEKQTSFDEGVDSGSESVDAVDDDDIDDDDDDEPNPAHDDDDNDDGSDDEAPESVGFSDSRTTVLAQLRSAMKQVDDEKQKQKDKRKKKQVMFKEQKEKKMKYTDSTKLPDDILKSIDSVIPKNIKHKKRLLKQRARSEKRKNKDKTKNYVQPEKEKKGQKVTSHPAGSLGDDYIPFVDEASGVAVTEIRQFEKQQKSLAQKAADFRNSRLNSRDIPRESNRARLLKLEKKKQRLM